MDTTDYIASLPVVVVARLEHGRGVASNGVTRAVWALIVDGIEVDWEDENGSGRVSLYHLLHRHGLVFGDVYNVGGQVRHLQSAGKLVELSYRVAGPEYTKRCKLDRQRYNNARLCGSPSLYVGSLGGPQESIPVGAMATSDSLRALARLATGTSDPRIIDWTSIGGDFSSDRPTWCEAALGARAAHKALRTL